MDLKMLKIDALEQIRQTAAPRQTTGLDDAAIGRFLITDARLRQAVDAAAERHRALLIQEPDLVRMSEAELCATVQRDYLNFYGADARCPYVPLAAAGPWIVTSHGAVLHDSGGYGMLGLGHGPSSVGHALAEPHVMANIMTPSIGQKRFADRLKKEIGHTRDGCPFDRFLCMNSGSEAVTIAARICDLSAGQQTGPGGPHQGQQVKTLSLEGSFHGRTELAARMSDSTFSIYRSHLASYRDREALVTVVPNDLDGLRAVFQTAEAQGVCFDSFFIEPVLGEGVPGLALTPAFYELARHLTAAHGALLVVDSIQAGLRATGHLSIADYPGFEKIDPPDMETYSKALNGGQYPLSVLALTEKAAGLYVTGIYGNTMTATPRALEVGCAVLDEVTDPVRRNIQHQGAYFLEQLKALQKEFPKDVVGVSGTGLMVCAELHPERHPVMGKDSFESYLRKHGITMVHGGKNGLRFTPHFAITPEEIDLIVSAVRQGLAERSERANRRYKAAS